MEGLGFLKLVSQQSDMTAFPFQWGKGLQGVVRDWGPRNPPQWAGSKDLLCSGFYNKESKCSFSKYHAN